MDDEVANLLDITLVLDPRFKTKYVKRVDDVLVQQCDTLASATPEPPRN